MTCEAQIVKPNYYSHLRLTPPSLMRSTEFITQAIWIIAKKFTPQAVMSNNINTLTKTALPLDKLEQEFSKATGQKISDFFTFQEGQLMEFLKNRPRMFKILESAERKTHVVLPQEYFVASEFRLEEVSKPPTAASPS